jgi:endogenous inhibitor of DNA gyrase (YacG/DUF329 family)
MAQAICPTCMKQFDPAASSAMPFCSSRCRQIDLGRWLNEEIVMPVDDPDEDKGPRKIEDDPDE